MTTTALEDDPLLRYSVLTYDDPTGEQAVRHWFQSVTA